MSKQSESLSDAVAKVKKRVARVPLSDGDLLILACEEITRSVSYEEMQYCSGKPC